MIYNSLEFALDFLKEHPSWYFFPIKRLCKFPPLIKDDLAQASNNPLQIRKWHATNLGCNWGLSLKKSNCLVVDVDRKPGKIGEQTFDALDMEYGFPETFTVNTPS